LETKSRIALIAHRSANDDYVRTFRGQCSSNCPADSVGASDNGGFPPSQGISEEKLPRPLKIFSNSAKSAHVTSSGKSFVLCALAASNIRTWI